MAIKEACQEKTEAQLKEWDTETKELKPWEDKPEIEHYEHIEASRSKQETTPVWYALGAQAAIIQLQTDP